MVFTSPLKRKEGLNSNTTTSIGALNIVTSHQKTDSADSSEESEQPLLTALTPSGSVTPNNEFSSSANSPIMNIPNDYRIVIDPSHDDHSDSFSTLKTTNTSHSIKQQQQQQQQNLQQHIQHSHGHQPKHSGSASGKPKSTTTSSDSSNNLFTGLLFLLFMILIFICIYYFSNNLIGFLEFVKDLGILGNVIVALAYLPTGIPLAIFSYYIPLTLSSGFIYGFITGFITVAVGSAVSASFGFWITRKITLKWFESKIEASHRLTSLRNLLEKHPKKIIIFMRLLPIPFGLQNGLCAVTRISYTTFITASVIGLLPENCVIAYIGSTIQTLTDITSNNNHHSITSYQQNLLIAAIVLGVILSCIGRKVLQSHTPPPIANISSSTLFQNSSIQITTNETTTTTTTSTNDHYNSPNNNSGSNSKQIDNNRDIILVIKSSSSQIHDTDNNSQVI